MGERALGIGLGLLTVALWICPIVAAFGSHGWDLKETLMPSETQVSEIKNKVEGLVVEDISEESVTVMNDEVNLTTNEFGIFVELDSPFTVSGKLLNISMKVSCESHDVLLGSGKMRENVVDLPASGTATFYLVGNLTPEGSRHIETFHEGNLPEVSVTGFLVELELYGVNVKVEKEED
ncbi:hypothetical protein AKJ57_06105 [candidate division MSBL1 archaeon SCGC-AAA259A05]|uniref:Uncharacterized protein n=1 Tax=candidate division MSBL1 archaeon SCGC-AAA259A05 TaxID=1698259 RepID=A0A133U412_9EURY|nr:hypothetical protein AKJ57_06105 [candidate division MSBL1 archaeon SCGC-AAA259A05]